MREIEFRGKCEYNDKWYYGFLYKDCFILDSDDNDHGEYRSDDNETWIDTYMYCVDNTTVGQDTGLKDKNGTKIFEGDIVEFETNVNCLTNELKPYWKDCIEKQYVIGGGTWWVRKDQAVVQWNSKDGMWDLKVYNNGRYKRKSKLFTYRESDYVVIGNIYDNPELVNGE